MALLDPSAIDRLVRAFGDEGRLVVAELVATFLSESPTILAALRDGVAGADPSEVRRAGHSLKAGAATLGASDLASICREVEARGEAGDLAGAAALVPTVEAEFDRARAALEAAVA